MIRSRPRGDAHLTMLLLAQCFTTFVAVPAAAWMREGHRLLDLAHLLFASICIVTLTERRDVKAALFVGLVLLAAGPPLWDRVGTDLGLGEEALHQVIVLVAFVFNALVTALVVRRTFGPGRVTVHRVQGAVLIYLNVAALCAIAFDLLELHAPGAVRVMTGGILALAPGARTAELSYFSLSTITTAGYGDLVPVHPLARSLANFESVFGQLFPATFLSRLVALHLADSSRAALSAAEALPSASGDAHVGQ
jgi:hypothetical protein